MLVCCPYQLPLAATVSFAIVLCLAFRNDRHHRHHHLAQGFSYSPHGHRSSAICTIPSSIIGANNRNKKCTYDAPGKIPTIGAGWALRPPPSSSSPRALAATTESNASEAKDGGKDEPSSLSEQEIMDESMEYLARLITHRLQASNNARVGTDDAPSECRDGERTDNTSQVTHELAEGRFVDLVTTHRGERMLEDLFLSPPRDDNDDEQLAIITKSSHDDNIRIVRGAITALQSLLIYGMQVGVKGSEESQAKMVRHLFRVGDNDANAKANDPASLAVMAPPSGDWTPDCVRRLKYRQDTTLGKLVLAKLVRKRTAQGAFDLLVEMGAWDRHEDTALLRSGFPIRFLGGELDAAARAETDARDVDDVLGIRRDLRRLKIYTIDGASTLDIDDGISVQVLDDGDGNDDARRYRYWVHIADVDRWAGRGSELLEAAERRGTSLYLPTMTLPMFPPSMESIMSLESREDRCALSLGVELDPADGSIIPSSIILTPSLVNVDYRLTYDQADEMLEYGLGYAEEWEMGALLDAATKRRARRAGRGSTEAMVPFPIPRAIVTATTVDEGTGQREVSLKIETTHNSGANATMASVAGGDDEDDHYDPFCSPVSSSNLIVTEMMILAGEAIGTWQKLQPMPKERSTEDGRLQLPNVLEFPFRRQPAPDFKSRQSEVRQMDLLLETNRRYPHAWYARRFFNKVTVSEEPGPHFGMGLDSYVQWTSPIRRLTDLQVHSALKRYLRRKRVNELLRDGSPIPSEVSSMDLGYKMSEIQQQQTTKNDNIIRAIDPIDYTSGLGMIFAGRPVQSSSTNYWLFEHIRRLVKENGEDEVMFESIVLGCVNPDRLQYAVYVYELGLEHRYLSESGELGVGKRLWLKVVFVNPRTELLTFSLASRSGGIHNARQSMAPAA